MFCLLLGTWPFTIKMLLGDKALAMLNGDYHKQVRKTLAPAFTPKANQQYIPRIVEIAEELCAEWADAKHVKGEDVVKAYTYQVCCIQFPHVHVYLFIPGQTWKYHVMLDN